MYVIIIVYVTSHR